MTSLSRGLALGAVSAVLAATAACGSDDASSAQSDATQVVVGFYPLQFVAERVGGDHVAVTSLAQPGAEPHDLEITAQQIGLVADSSLVLYEKGLQPAVDLAVEQNAADHALDVATVTTLHEGYEELGEENTGSQAGHEDEGTDPHIWLDPTIMTKIVSAVADRLAKDDSAHAEDYRANATALTSELTALDEEYKTGLATCERKDIVTTHNAFGYLADRYGLTQVGIAGLSPDDEPSPQKLAEVRSFAQEHGVTTIFYEESVSPKYAETIASEVGAETAVLSPIEVASDGKDYLDIMRSNLASLRTALGCQ